MLTPGASGPPKSDASVRIVAVPQAVSPDVYLPKSSGRDRAIADALSMIDENRAKPGELDDGTVGVRVSARTEGARARHIDAVSRWLRKPLEAGL